MTKPIPTLDTLRAHREAIFALAAQYGVSNIRVFGSVARGEATPNSDIDLLVTYEEGTSLWDAVGLWQDLQELLGYDISLLGDEEHKTPKKQRLMRRAMADAVAL